MSTEEYPVPYIRIWTVLYNILTNIEELNRPLSLTQETAPFFQRLVIQNDITITYTENFQLTLNMLTIIKRSKNCRIRVDAHGFCDDIMTFLKALPRLDAIRLTDICSNETIDFDELLACLTLADDIEIDMFHVKYKHDPGLLLMRWKRPANVKKFVLRNLNHDVNKYAVAEFCKVKVLSSGHYDLTYVKTSK